MNKKSILKVAQTYKFMVESAIEPQMVPSDGPSWNDLMDLLNNTDDPTAEQLQNITPRPTDFANGYYDWNQNSGRWEINMERYYAFRENLARELATRIAQQEAEEVLRRGIAQAKGRRAILAKIISSLAASGLAIYLSIEDILQIIDDYFNSAIQVDVPDNFELYRPFGSLWNLATTDYPPLLPPDPVDPVAP